jgi:hypothetical protein
MIDADKKSAHAKAIYPVYYKSVTQYLFIRNCTRMETNFIN